MSTPKAIRLFSFYRRVTWFLFLCATCTVSSLAVKPFIQLY